MGYALRSDAQYTQLRSRNPNFNLISDKLFRARINTPSRREKSFINVEVAGQAIRLESTEPELPAPVAESLSRIADLAEFEANWNSYGALPLQPSVVEPAIRLILATFPRCMQPEISLTPMGGLNLFWHREAKELEVEIRPDGFCDYSYEDGEAQAAPAHPVPLSEMQDFIGEVLR